MPKKFTPQEKNRIRRHLMDACEKSWAKWGYKKTSVADLCKQCGISKGAFYLFFESKELLFYETGARLQERLYDLLFEEMKKDPTKEGLISALKKVYRELDNGNWIINYSDPEYLVLLRSIPPAYLHQSETSGLLAFEALIRKSGLKPAADFKFVASVVGTLMYTLITKDYVASDYTHVFDFLIEQTVLKLFEPQEV